MMKNVGWLLSAMMMLWVQVGPAKADGDQEYQAIQAAVGQVAAAVVQIETIGAADERGELQLSAPISGTVIDPQGYILTSLWGLEQTPASILAVLGDSTRLPAQIVARDHSRELVLLKVDSAKPLVAAALSPSGTPRVGQWAIAVGRGISLKHPSVSVGIVSATERMNGRAVQIDARVSPSFYGGPVVDVTGAMIGVSVPMKPAASSAGDKADWYDSGISFVVPCDAIAKRLPQLKSGNDVWPGKMGIVPESKNPFSKDRKLAAVLALSPAKRAGIEAEDELVQINGKPVRWVAEIKQLLGPLDAGESVSVKVRRDGKELAFDVPLAKDIPVFKPRVLGVIADQQEDRIEITHVFPDSPASKADVRVGDTIAQIDGKPLDDLARFRMLVTTHMPDNPLAIELLRKGKTQRVECELTGVPEEISSELPKLPSIIPKSGWEVKVRSLPDVPNKGFLLMPKKKPDHALALLVLLARPGDKTNKESLQAWHTFASEHGCSVMMISPQEKDRWKPAESDVVLRLVQQAIQLIQIDPQQVAIAGLGSGAEMGMMVALRNADVFHGAVCFAASRPGGFSLSENDPSKPLQFLVLGAKEIPVWGRLLAKSGYPVLHQATTAKDPFADDAQVLRVLGNWIRLLSRI